MECAYLHPIICTLLNVFFRQSEVHDVTNMGILANSHQKIVRLYVPMKDMLLMNCFDSLHHLLAYLQHSFY